MRTASIQLPGHPDRACDVVAEAIVDEYARRDPASRLRLSVSGGRGVLFVSGDVLSQADFDVSALVRRTLGSIGITDDVEPFVSLEAVSAESVSAMRLPSEIPVTVTGYATRETDLFLPSYVVLADRVARALQRLREQDEDCFWLGPDADVVASVASDATCSLTLRVEHGTESLERVRTTLTARLADAAGGARIDINPGGACERRGLVNVSGASRSMRSLYGSMLPAICTGVGRDAHAAEKAGAWLARSAAITAVKSGAQAAFVTATYLPGILKPVDVRIRDERGRDLSSCVLPEAFALDRVTTEWWRPNLHTDALIGGVVLDLSLPWNA